MTLFFLENGIGKARYAIYSSKRLGGAVSRNRIKRMFREILNYLRLRLRGYDFIIIPREGVKEMRRQEVDPLVEVQLLDVGVITK